MAPPSLSAVRRALDLDEDIANVLAEQDRIKAVMRAAHRDLSFVSAGPEGEWINPGQFTRAVKGGVPSPSPTPSRRARPGCSTLYQFAMTDSRFREVAAQRELLQS